jgi:zinc protease
MRRYAAAAALAVVTACAPLVRGAPGPGADPFVAVGDTAVVRGTLPNGLAYYIRSNAEPPGRAELRLLVDVGSLREDEDQLGLAHFLEHMAFNGTRRFERQALVHYLESVGMRFGPDVNAYTSFEETVYSLHLPVDRPGVLETGIRILADWAGGIELDDAEIERERGVVLEEWRRMRGAGMRLAERQLPFLLEGSRYATRFPIGDPEVLASFPPGALRRFHARWYRPDLMAVVVVGDVDPAEVERLLREEFSGIPARRGAVPPVPAGVPVPDTTRYLVSTDAELPRGELTFTWLRPAPRDTSRANARRAVVEQLFVGILAERLNERTLAPGSPFLDVGSFHGTSFRRLETLVLSASFPAEGAEQAVAGMAAELARAGRHGFTPGELDRERRRMLRSWEQLYAERARITSAELAGRYAQHFLRGGTLWTLEDEYGLQTHLVPSVTLAEVNAAARRFAAGRRLAILLGIPTGTATPPPDRARVAELVRAAGTAPHAGPEADAADGPLLAAEPAGGRVVEEAFDSVAGVHRWTLSNGARVVVRPTDFREDEILFAATSEGGLSLVPDSLLLDARVAGAAVQLAGLGELSLTALQHRLAGRAASIGPHIGELSEGMNGVASPDDLPLLLQLVHLYFTEPRRDESAWEAYLARAREGLRNRERVPETMLSDTLAALLSGGHPRSRTLDAARFDSVDLDRALAIYRERFAGAGDFTFYFVGRVDAGALRPLVERYLAGLPGGEPEGWVDHGIRPPDGVVERVVRAGSEPKARTVLVLTGPAPFSRGEAARLRTLLDVLQLRLRDRLREELGGTYGVSVSGGLSAQPWERYAAVIDFGSAPERVDELLDALMEEMRDLRERGPDPAALAAVQESHRRQRELALRENSAWMTTLVEYDRHGWEIGWFLEVPLSGALGADAVRDAARRYLAPQRRIRVTLLPADGPGAASP